MKKGIDYRIWRLGEWLETFLDEEVRAKDFFCLAKNAMKHLNVECEVKREDPVFSLIEEIEKAGERLFDKDNWGRILESKLNGEIEINLERPLQDQDPAVRQALEETDRINSLLEIPGLRRSIRILLKIISESDRPWRQVLGELHGTEAKSLGYALEPGIINQLIERYGEVNETLVLSKYELRKIRRFTDPADREEIPWDVLIARIFFDFLLLGGRDRYGFCERCDKMFIIQRKGRKRFCSDICRVLDHQEKSERNAS